MLESKTPVVTIDPHQAAVLTWMQQLAPYGILTTDTELRVQSWNAWLEAHSGLAASVVVGRPLLELFPDLVERKMDERFRRALAGEVIVLSTAFHEFLLPFETAVQDPAFRYMQQTVRIAPLTLPDGLSGTITIIEDVTEREAQSLDLLRRHQREQLLSSCLAKLLETRDPDNMIHSLFPKMTEHLDIDMVLAYRLEPDQQHLRLQAIAGIPENHNYGGAVLALGESISGKAAAERRVVVVNNLQSSKVTSLSRSAGARAAAAFPLLVKDQLLGTIAFGTRKRDAFSDDEIEIMGSVSQYVAIALDRAESETELREAKQQLSEHAGLLEAKVSERTANLQDVIVQLESFSYTVAHDLRAPIRALQGYTQVLLAEPPQIDPKTARQYLVRIDRAANRLGALTRDLLQFSSISRQDVQFTRIELTDLVHDVRMARPALDDTFLVKEPLHSVLGNATLLQQCLTNLVDNAIKFTQPGLKPKIVLSTEMTSGNNPAPAQSAPEPFIPAAHPRPREAQNGTRVRLWVEDNGIGIPPQYHEKIFGIFERLNAADKYEGTGIGLAIVARAMQRMGGSCGVESAPGQGSRFWLELPAA